MRPEARAQLDARLAADGTTLTRVVIEALKAYVDLDGDPEVTEVVKDPTEDASIHSGGPQG